jgi:hypothetical protein
MPGPYWHTGGRNKMQKENEYQYLSQTAISNLFTMGLAAEIDRRQAVIGGYHIPNLATRVLRGELCAEECVFELLEGLGLELRHKGEKLSRKNCEFVPSGDANLVKIIDACCDGIYVLTGTMVACGAPDMPHMAIVNYANNAKFPNGKVTMHPTISGKYGKPEGWKEADHCVLIDALEEFSHTLPDTAGDIIAASRLPKEP